MTDEQTFIIAVLTLLAPTSVSIATLFQTRRTHDAVNGLVAKGNRRARRAGRLQGQADQVTVNPTTLIGPQP